MAAAGVALRDKVAATAGAHAQAPDAPGKSRGARGRGKDRGSVGDSVEDGIDTLLLQRRRFLDATRLVWRGLVGGPDLLGFVPQTHRSIWSCRQSRACSCA